MQIKAFFDSRTSTLTYVVWDPDSRDAVVIDPVLDYDEAASVTFTESVDAVLGFVAEQRLRPHCVLETHAHADHLFPGGSAAGLYDSITRRIYVEPDRTRIFVGHDYQPGGRELRYEATVGEQKRHNVALSDRTSREQFVAFREARDASLSAPKLLFRSVQVNIDAGRLPRPEAELAYLKIPLNAFKPRAAPPAPRIDDCVAAPPAHAQG